MAKKKKEVTEQVEQPASVLPQVVGEIEMATSFKNNLAVFSDRLEKLSNVPKLVIANEVKIVKIDNHVEYETARQRYKALTKEVKVIDEAIKEVVEPITKLSEDVKAFGEYLKSDADTEKTYINTLLNKYIIEAAAQEEDFLKKQRATVLERRTESASKDKLEKEVVEAVNKLMASYASHIQETWQDSLDAQLNIKTLKETYQGQNTFKDYAADYYDKKWEEAFDYLDSYAQQYLDYLDGNLSEPPAEVQQVYQEINLDDLEASSKPVTMLMPTKGFGIAYELSVDDSKPVPATLAKDLYKTYITMGCDQKELIKFMLDKLAKEHKPEENKVVDIEGVVVKKVVKATFH